MSASTFHKFLLSHQPSIKQRQKDKGVF